MRSVVALVVAFAILAGAGSLLAPYDPSAIDVPARPAPPSLTHPLGTDALGHDILSRLLHGARWSLGLAFPVSGLGLAIGTLAGLVAALGGRVAD
jgi:peptide/nickel transport system permease protein